MRLRATLLRPSGGLRPLASIIKGLFANGEQGVWYDPSDFSTMFQDAAGTIPVTAVEQPVGRILDKSGRGNHASQTAATSRPVLSARVNQFLNSELTGAVAGAPGTPPTSWLSGNSAGEIGNSAVGVRFVANATRRTAYQSILLAANTAYRMRCKVNVAVPVAVSQMLGTTTATVFSVQYYCDGQAVSSNFAPSVGEHEVVWDFVSPSTSGNFTIQIGVGVQNTTTGDVTFLKTDFRPANTGTNLPGYQRVNTATDYDTAGFPRIERFDAVDDVQNITFPVSLGSNCTVARVAQGGAVTILTGQTIGTSYQINQSHAGLIVVNRALTQSETSAVTRYLQRKGIGQ